jgi:hypothetical protein
MIEFGMVVSTTMPNSIKEVNFRKAGAGQSWPFETRYLLPPSSPTAGGAGRGLRAAAHLDTANLDFHGFHACVLLVSAQPCKPSRPVNRHDYLVLNGRSALP